MTELERQELIKVRDLLLKNAENANNLFWGSLKEEDANFFEGRQNAFNDAATLLTRLIGED